MRTIKLSGVLPYYGEQWDRIAKEHPNEFFGTVYNPPNELPTDYNIIIHICGTSDGPFSYSFIQNGELEIHLKECTAL